MHKIQAATMVACKVSCCVTLGCLRSVLVLSATVCHCLLLLPSAAAALHMPYTATAHTALCYTQELCY